MSDNLQRAIAAIRSGDKETGKRLLAEVIRNDPRNEAAWLWMSSVVDSDEQRRTYLERVLAIKPQNQTARRGLEALGQKRTEEPTPSEKQPQHVPFTSSNALQQIKRIDQQTTKKCPYCAETIKAEAVVCRFCGRDLTTKRAEKRSPQQPKKKKSKVGNYVVAIIGAFIVVCCGLYYLGDFLTSGISSTGSFTNDEPSINSPEIGAAEDFVDLLDWDCEDDSIGNTIFTGRVKNTHSSRTLRSVRLRATVVDANDHAINTQWSYIDSDILAPNSTSTFTVYVDNPNYEGETCKIRVESARFE